jgi:hypothetical protein
VSKKSFTLPALLAALACVTLNPTAAWAKTGIEPSLLGPVVTLSLTRGDGTTLDVTVDGGGGFQSANYSTAAGGFLQDFSYDSLVMVNLVEGESSNISLISPTRAESSFSTQGLDVRLNQSLSEGTLAGSFLLTQTYRVTNPAAEPVTVNLYRYQDTDLAGGDGGYIAPGSRYAYLVNNLAPDSSSFTSYIGVAAYTGQPMSEQRVAVQVCCRAYEVDPEFDRTVTDDADADGLSDALGDRTISRRAALTLAAGASATVTTKTLMGRTALNSLRELPRR